MPSRPPNRISRKNKSWRITIFIQERREILGDVEAPTREAAEAAAVKQFALSAEDRNRIVIQERS
jgi:hypothetical protein